MASDCSLHCLSLMRQFLDISSGVKITCINFRRSMVRNYCVLIIRVKTVAVSLYQVQSPSHPKSQNDEEPRKEPYAIERTNTVRISLCIRIV